MVSSSASEVNGESPTRFQYHERAGLVWGDYYGDTVEEGHFVGDRVEDRVNLAFGHVTTSGTTTTGTALVTISTDDQGRLRLTEDFTIDGTSHISVCIENENG